MRRKHATLALALVTVLLVGACLTQREKAMRVFTEAPLLGMVYDHDQAPCANALIVVDGTDGPHTDINGRFQTDPIARGEHRVAVRKAGYEELEVSLDFMDRNQVLYLRVVSVDQLLRQAEAALEGKRLGEADAILARAEAVEPGNPVASYLRALLHLEREEAEPAVRILAELERRGYREPIVYLTLADIHQFRLGEEAEAIAALEKYLALQGDPEAARRLAGLRAREK